MYEHLRGTLVEKTPTRAVVDVGGVGYEVSIPVSSFEALPSPGERVEVLTHLIVREDALRLVGFASADERRFFRRLIDVQGIGPAVALSVLSSTSYGPFRTAVLQEDLSFLTRLKGIGRKLAQRIVLDLREVLEKEVPDAAAELRGPDRSRIADDAVGALVTLGFPRAAAAKEVDRILRESGESPGLEEVVRRALKSTR